MCCQFESRKRSPIAPDPLDDDRMIRAINDGFSISPASPPWPRRVVGLAGGTPPGGCHSSPFVPIHPLGISPRVPIFWSRLVGTADGPNLSRLSDHGDLSGLPRPAVGLAVDPLTLPPSS